jgi:hypothetical protein
MKRAAIILWVLAMVAPAAAQGVGILTQFDGGIGVIPVSSAAGPVNADGTFPNVNKNFVRNVPPSGQNWRIGDLKADIFMDGRIRVKGSGLLLAGGNNIGLNGNLVVFATLSCFDAATNTFLEHSTTATGVPLDAAGNFKIDDNLGTLTECAAPVLLIRSSGGGSWLAAGIQKPADSN